MIPGRKADRIGKVRMVLFTFDDGPNPDHAGRARGAGEVQHPGDVLHRRGACSARRRELRGRPPGRRRILIASIVLAPNLGARAPSCVEIDEACDPGRNRQAGRDFRAPFGAIDNTGRGWLKKRGLTEAFWSVDTLDWQAKDAEKLRKKVLRMILKQDGGVVLMHDVKPITAKIIANVLDDLEAENCRRLADKPLPEPSRSSRSCRSRSITLRDKKQPRAIPDAVKKTTEAYRTARPVAVRRPLPPPPPEPPKPAQPVSPTPRSRPPRPSLPAIARRSP
jgi:hypothetical protein